MRGDDPGRSREIASLDRLSNGRTIFGAGLGVPVETDFAPFGEEVEDRMRAERLDEGLEILVGLWTGEPFGFSGTHFDLDEVVFTPTPVQRPRVPIWTACMLPNTKPLERAARWDGVVPFVPDRDMTAADITFVVDQISTPPGTEPFDVVFLGTAEADTDVVRDVAAAGATWWHALPTYGGAFAEFEAAVRRGPSTF